VSFSSRLPTSVLRGGCADSGSPLCPPSASDCPRKVGPRRPERDETLRLIPCIRCRKGATFPSAPSSPSSPWTDPPDSRRTGRAAERDPRHAQGKGRARRSAVKKRKSCVERRSDHTCNSGILNMLWNQNTSKSCPTWKRIQPCVWLGHGARSSFAPMLAPFDSTCNAWSVTPRCRCWRSRVGTKSACCTCVAIGRSPAAGRLAAVGADRPHHPAARGWPGKHIDTRAAEQSSGAALCNAFALASCSARHVQARTSSHNTTLTRECIRKGLWKKDKVSLRN